MKFRSVSSYANPFATLFHALSKNLLQKFHFFCSLRLFFFFSVFCFY